MDEDYGIQIEPLNIANQQFSKGNDIDVNLDTTPAEGFVNLPSGPSAQTAKKLTPEQQHQLDEDSIHKKLVPMFSQPEDKGPAQRDFIDIGPTGYKDITLGPGLDSHENFQNKAAESQSWTDRMWNDVKVAGVGAGVGFSTIFTYTPEAIKNLDISTGEDSFTNTLNNFYTQFAEENQNYQTQYDSQNPIKSLLLPGFLTGSSKGWGEILRSASIGLGSAAGLMTVETGAALAFPETFGASSVVAAGGLAAASRNFIRTGQAISALFKSEKTLANAYNAAKTAYQGVNSTIALKKSLEFSKNLARTFVISAGEAEMEANESRRKIKNDYIQQHVLENGALPDAEQLQKVELLAEKAHDYRFALNLATLSLSNQAMTKALFKPFGTVSTFAEGLAQRGLKPAIGAGGKIIAEKANILPDLFGRHIAAGVFKDGIEKGLRVLKGTGKGITASEGIEEGLQHLYGKSTENYFTSLLDEDYNNIVEKSFGETLGGNIKALWENKQELVSDEGLQNIVGGILGGSGQALIAKVFDKYGIRQKDGKPVTNKDGELTTTKAFEIYDKQKIRDDNFNEQLSEATDSIGTAINQLILAHTAIKPSPLTDIEVTAAVGKNQGNQLESKDKATFDTLNIFNKFKVLEPLMKTGYAETAIELLQDDYKHMNLEDFNTIIGATGENLIKTEAQKNQVIASIQTDFQEVNKSFGRVNGITKNQYPLGSDNYKQYEAYKTLLTYHDYSFNELTKLKSNHEINLDTEDAQVEKMYQSYIKSDDYNKGAFGKVIKSGISDKKGDSTNELALQKAELNRLKIENEAAQAQTRKEAALKAEVGSGISVPIFDDTDFNTQIDTIQEKIDLLEENEKLKTSTNREDQFKIIDNLKAYVGGGDDFKLRKTSAETLESAYAYYNILDSLNNHYNIYNQLIAVPTSKAGDMGSLRDILDKYLDDAQFRQSQIKALVKYARKDAQDKVSKRVLDNSNFTPAEKAEVFDYVSKGPEEESEERFEDAIEVVLAKRKLQEEAQKAEDIAKRAKEDEENLRKAELTAEQLKAEAAANSKKAEEERLAKEAEAKEAEAKNKAKVPELIFNNEGLELPQTPEGLIDFSFNGETFRLSYKQSGTPEDLTTVFFYNGKEAGTLKNGLSVYSFEENKPSNSYFVEDANKWRQNVYDTLKSSTQVKPDVADIENQPLPINKTVAEKKAELAEVFKNIYTGLQAEKEKDVEPDFNSKDSINLFAEVLDEEGNPTGVILREGDVLLEHQRLTKEFEENPDKFFEQLSYEERDIKEPDTEPGIFNPNLSENGVGLNKNPAVKKQSFFINRTVEIDGKVTPLKMHLLEISHPSTFVLNERGRNYLGKAIELELIPDGELKTLLTKDEPITMLELFTQAVKENDDIKVLIAQSFFGLNTPKDTIKVNERVNNLYNHFTTKAIGFNNYQNVVVAGKELEALRATHNISTVLTWDMSEDKRPLSSVLPTLVEIDGTKFDTLTSFAGVYHVKEGDTFRPLKDKENKILEGNKKLQDYLKTLVIGNHFITYIKGYKKEPSFTAHALYRLETLNDALKTELSGKTQEELKNKAVALSDKYYALYPQTTKGKEVGKLFSAKKTEDPTEGTSIYYEKDRIVAKQGNTKVAEIKLVGDSWELFEAGNKTSLGSVDFISRVKGDDVLFTPNSHGIKQVIKNYRIFTSPILNKVILPTENPMTIVAETPIIPSIPTVIPVNDTVDMTDLTTIKLGNTILTNKFPNIEEVSKLINLGLPVKKLIAQLKTIGYSASAISQRPSEKTIEVDVNNLIAECNGVS